MKRRPRKLKKAVKNCVVTVDICSIPEWVDLEHWYNLFHDTGVAIWDSRKGGEPPRVTPYNKRIRICLNH